MKPCFTILCCCIVVALAGQVRQFRFIDAETNAPLGYVHTGFTKTKVNGYSDSNGVFRIDLSPINKNDSIIFSHIGFHKQVFALADLPADAIIRMARLSRNLDPVMVKHCTTPRIARTEWPRKARHHFSVSPALTIVFAGAYENITGQSGYLHRIGFHVADYSNYLDVPVRLRWYEWDETNQDIAREMTDTSLVFMPTKKGWNYFPVPDRVVPVHGQKLVLGIEFIYPPWMDKEYKAAIGKETDTDWRKRRLFWFIGMEKGPDAFSSDDLIRQLVYHKVALRIEVKTCL